MQAIASTGVSYIRDDLNAATWETSPGVYVLPPWDMGWLNAAKAKWIESRGCSRPEPEIQLTSTTQSPCPILRYGLPERVWSRPLKSPTNRTTRTPSYEGSNLANKAGVAHKRRHNCCSRC